MAGAVAGGDRLESLLALRDRLAREIDGCRSARDVAALSARLMSVLEQVAEVEAQQPKRGGTPLDELERRRAARMSAAAG